MVLVAVLELKTEGFVGKAIVVVFVVVWVGKVVVVVLVVL